MALASEVSLGSLPGLPVLSRTPDGPAAATPPAPSGPDSESPAAIVEFSAAIRDALAAARQNAAGSGSALSLPPPPILPDPGDLDAQIDELDRFDPVTAGKLRILLKALQELSPEELGRSIQRLSEFADRMLELASRLHDAPSSTPVPAAPPSPQSSPAAEASSLTISIEIQASARLEEFIAQVEGGDVHVRQTVIEARQTIRLDIAIGKEPPKRADPLALDLDGNGVNLTTVQGGQNFDIDGDGQAEQTAFIAGGDAFLALDANGNGRVDSGKELFGDQEGDKNGFEKLARHDSNRDGIIDSDDAVFDRLRLLMDINRDGRVAPQELVRLSDAGVSSLNLAHRSIQVEDGKGNAASEYSAFTRYNGSKGLLVDVLVGHEG